nr:TonB-dependent receptor [Govania unica]
MAQGNSAALSEPLEEIVVTSRRRDERLVDVPIAVSVFNAATIERAGITRAADFLALTPNVQFIQTTNVGESQVHIRGIIQPRDAEPPFAYVVDGVLVPNPSAFNGELVDIDQIEVIKGPIGSIYGRNAVGGAILVSTKKPGNEFEGKVKGSYEVEGQEWSVNGFVSGPVVKDKLYARLTAGYLDRKGYYDNVTLHEKEDPFREGQVRGRVVWDATDNIQFDFSGGYAKVKGYAFNFNNQTAGTPGFRDGVDINDTSIQNAGNVRSFNNQKRYDATAKMDWNSEYGTLSIYGAYHKLNEDMGGEGAVDLALFGFYPSFSPVNFFIDPTLYEGYGPTPRDGTQYQARNQTDKSAEIRFTSPGDKRLRYIAGAYYIVFDRAIILNRADDMGNGVVVANPLGDPVTNPVTALTWTDNHNKAYALFGQLAFDITEKVELSAAARWDKEERGTTNLTPANYVTLAGDSGRKRNANFSKVQPRVSLRYKPTEDTSFYATYGEGFRSGGFNPLGSRFNIINIDGVTNTTVQDAFDKETSKSMELGFKASLLDHRFSINGAAFASTVHNAQYFQFFPFSLSRVISIVDKNQIWGFEFDVNARVTDGLNLFGGFGYLHSTIKANAENPETIGNSMPFTPEYNVILGAQYSKPITDGINGVVRVEYTRTGPLYYDTLNTPGTRRDALNLVNARLGVEGETWTATLWSRNLFNKHYNVDGVVLVVPNVTVFDFVTKGAPRTFGLEVAYKF